MVYPGEQSFSLVLSPTNYPCVRETASATTCTAHTARDDVLEITITQTNDIGSIVDQLPLDNYSFFLAIILFQNYFNTLLLFSHVCAIILKKLLFVILL